MGVKTLECVPIAEDLTGTQKWTMETAMAIAQALDGS